jgi:protein involved in polysaccharide export with SLBB domain
MKISLNPKKNLLSGFLLCISLPFLMLLIKPAGASAQQAASAEAMRIRQDTTLRGKSPAGYPMETKEGMQGLRNEVSGGLTGTQLPLSPGQLQAQLRLDSLQDQERKIFGYAVFHNNPVGFTPNLNMATPKNYVVGPGDILLLQVYGVAQNRYSLTVSPEGAVNIPDIGLAKVGGFTIEAVKSILLNKLAIRYSGISGNSPNTFLEVTLSNIRTIKVNMVGEIFRPGSYNLPSYVNVFNALFAAGGPTVKGTFRHVQVYRANKLAAEIDVYDYLLTGKITRNIRLEDDDVILIRPASNRVELSGQVRTPGIYEFKSNETFTDVLRFAGGFSDKAYKEMVNVLRKGVTEMQVFDLSSSQFSSASLNDGDVVNVNEILDRFSNRVQISGAVYRPGPYALVKGMTAQDLIVKSGGLKGDAFLKRAILYRTKKDFTQEVLSLDLNATSGPNSPANIILDREDVLSIANIHDIQEEFYVQITGEVNNVGVYPFGEKMTVSDLVFKAGGFKYSASGSFIEIVRRVEDASKVADIITVSIDKDLKISDSASRIQLLPFDHVFVRTTPGFQTTKTVSVEGEVLYRGMYAIDKKEMRISDLVKRAGGLTSYAYVPGATLVRRTKKYTPPTKSETENNNLNNLKDNLNADGLLAQSESNKLVSKRIDSKINQNKATIAKEQEILAKEALKQNLFKDNTSVFSSSNAAAFDEKEQELVAIDLSAILKAPGSVEDLVLKEGDVLTIPEKLETVSVKGGVLYPVSIRYDPSISFNEYINRAGGYNNRAIKNKAYVLQANGRIKRVRNYFLFRTFPKVEPGAEIFVPSTLQEKPPFNYASTVGTITTLVTSTLTLILLFRNL